MTVTTAKDFCFNQTQPYFIYFLLINRYKIGTAYRTYDFSLWINKKHTEFQNTVGEKWLNRIGISENKVYQNEFMNWLYTQYRS